jgi:serine/threonine protein kinase/tetratricopeptide (TPR) repeat protein
MEPKSVDRIYWDAAQIDSPAEREAYLARTCADDIELRQRVVQLLQARSKVESFLESPAPNLVATANEQPVSEGSGTVIDEYKLLEQIGEGGFGVVFMAEQQEPIRRKVALKVLKPGMDSRQVIARFEAERQALALMDHPNIAKVLDGGQAASGRPYFVMDLVKGMPITDYCDQNQLTPRERLELFVHVCQAVQHAHQKGIIHRDLKPSNILVTLHDGTPVPKIIDFGISKALGQQLTDKTLYTGFAQLVGTPLYMSPEQAALSGLDVDTRSDIYSLGVLLYELLTGTTPFDKERLHQAGYDELRRIIREEEPPKPSTRISTLGQAATTPSMQRKSDPKRLSQLCRGELDWIVMKCLEKDRNRRYETANGLAMDVQRYLHDEPVLACPPSAWYRLKKLGRRNKRTLVTAALLGVTLLAAVGAVAASLGWAARDRAATLAAAEEKVKGALEEAIQLQRQKKWPEALEAIKRAEGFLVDDGSMELAQRVEELRTDAEMVLRVDEIRFPQAVGGAEGAVDPRGADAAYAKAFREYGIDVDSLEPQEAATRVRARKIMLQLSVALDRWARRRKESGQGKDWQRLVAVARAADPDKWRNRVRDAMGRGDRTALNKLVASEKINDLPLQTLSLLAEALDSKHGRTVLQLAHRKYPDDFWINFQLAYLFDWVPSEQQDFAEAIRFYTAALALRPRNVATHLHLGHALRQHGKLDEAIAVYREALRLRPDPDIHRSLGATLIGQQKYAEAEAELRKALRLRLNFAVAHNDLGVALNGQRKPAEAEKEFREALRLRPDDAVAHSNLRSTLMIQRKFAEAEEEFRDALRLRPTFDARFWLAEALHKQGKDAEAVAEYRELLRQRPDDAGVHFNLGRSLIAQWNQPQAPALALEAEAAYRQALRLRPGFLEAHNGLGYVLLEQGKLAEAEAEYRKSLRLQPNVSETHSDLGWVLHAQGKPAEAEAEFREALRLRPDLPEGHKGVGCVLHARGKLAAAEKEFQETLKLLRKRDGPESTTIAGALAVLGMTMLKQQKYAEAEQILRECLVIRDKQVPDNWLTFNARSMLGGVLLAQNKYTEAEPLLLEGYKGMKQREAAIPTEARVRLTEALERLVQLYQTTGRTENLRTWAKKLEEARAGVGKRKPNVK